MEEGSESANTLIIRCVCVYGRTVEATKPFLNYRRSDQRCSYPLLARPTATPLSPPLPGSLSRVGLVSKKATMGASSPFAEMLTHFTRTPYRIAGFRKGRGRARRAILQENGAQSEARRMESAYFSRHVCGNDHLFISSRSRAAALPPP